MRVVEHAPLQSFNTFHVAANARYLVTLESPDELTAFLADSRFSGLPLFVLGGGSNLLLTGDFAGVMLCPRFMGREVLSQEVERVRLRACAGESWDGFVDWAVAQGFAGLENLSCIPGHVGAAPVQNIGAYGVELQDVVERVEALDLSTGAAVSFTRDDCQFAYRDSVFKRNPGRYLITAVVFSLAGKFAPRLDYPGVPAALAAQQDEGPLSPARVRQAICAVRYGKLPDPAVLGNAGSFFKNPLVSQSLADSLKGEYASMPVYPAAAGLAKIPAAWLIEQCGFKGYRAGDAGVHEKHALVLVNYGQATGAELWALAEKIRLAVRQRFGVELEPEPNRL